MLIDVGQAHLPTSSVLLSNSLSPPMLLSFSFPSPLKYIFSMRVIEQPTHGIKENLTIILCDIKFIRGTKFCLNYSECGIHSIRNSDEMVHRSTWRRRLPIRAERPRDDGLSSESVSSALKYSASCPTGRREDPAESLYGQGYPFLPQPAGIFFFF